MRCKICRKKMKTLSWMHFKLHDLTIQEYFELYPKEKIKYHEERSAHFKSIYKDNPELIDRRIKYMKSDKNPMKNEEVADKFRGDNNPMCRPEIANMFKGENHPLYGIERTWMKGKNNVMNDSNNVIKMLSSRTKRNNMYTSETENDVCVWLKKYNVQFIRWLSILGSPDIAIIEPDGTIKTLIFIDGCFWHGCTKCKDWSKVKYETFMKMIERSHKDKMITVQLQGMGFNVIRLWEHDVDSGKFKQILKEVLA